MSPQPWRADRCRQWWPTAGPIAGLAAARGTWAGVGQQPAFRLATSGAGLHRLTFEEAAAAGLARPAPSASLAVTTRGEPVPIWVEDGGDAAFGPGDSIEFLAERLPGPGTYLHPYSPHNVYRLSWTEGAATRMGPLPRPPGLVPLARPRRTLHLERDRFLVRLSARELGPQEEPELWFWAKLTSIDREALLVDLPLRDLAPGAIELRVALRGLSTLRAGPALATFADHRLEVALNGEPLAPLEWDGRRVFAAQWTLAPGQLRTGDNHLEFEVPRRRPRPGASPLPDALVLDWIEIDYPTIGPIGAEAVPFRIAADGVVDFTPAPRPVRLYGAAGGRDVAVVNGPTRLSRGSYWAVPEGAVQRVASIEIDRPSRLGASDNRFDYIVLAHSSLLEAARPLAALHERRGLAVLLADVQDVYDEFNDGIEDPAAIRRFLLHAHATWRRPAPRWVVLVGDASWDTKNALPDANYANWVDRQLLARDRLPPRSATPHPGAVENPRRLVPTWTYHGEEGHAASDNGLVAPGGPTGVPALAIGRLPVDGPEELAAIVAKNKRYLAEGPGPWLRRPALLIANESALFRDSSERLAAELTSRGFEVERIYPEPAAQSHREESERLAAALAAGRSVVHFLGHGGRFIWRTGPADLTNRHDLFTLDHLDALPAGGPLSIVLSMTCYSAPFDHPSADSIGERFLRLPDRGAVAVVAASWRNTPNYEMSRNLIIALLEEPTVGEALVAAKAMTASDSFRALYNLLGDPALPSWMAAPLDAAAGRRRGAGRARPSRRDLDP